MSDILLSKPVLPAGWIDLSVGEAHIVRETLKELFSLSLLIPPAPGMFEYPNSQGYKPLVSALEEKHQAPVIITNGAKQGLGASFYALKQLGKSKIGMRTPYWALIPPLVKLHGLEPLTSYQGSDANLLLLPNNPDGFTSSPEVVKGFVKNCQARGVPVIHDAAYYTPTYMPEGFPLDPIGDLQIYSISKMFGLSGLRLGYIVCRNPEFYPHLLNYMEAMTVGVSSLPQIFLHQLFKDMAFDRDATQMFYRLSRARLQLAKEIFSMVKSEVLEVDKSVIDLAGMFGWFKVGPKANFKRSRVNVIDGGVFGVPGYVRINLAWSETQMCDIVDRMNSVC